MRHLGVWVAEFLKLLGGRRLHPLTTQCPICQQMVRLHVNKGGRRHFIRSAGMRHTPFSKWISDRRMYRTSPGLVMVSARS